MTNVAILGFGVVGSGVAKLITDNYKEVTALGGDGIDIKYILDLRDFPDSPFADRVIHDFSAIANDPEISVVIEVMGGSHPAYEYTMAALNSGKSVITSNKEVVAKYGAEFMKAAERNGVCYRFEAAVGGGIPVISPIINCVLQNKVKEVRGILNGTTNYILTQMFECGKSFESALRDAQAKGYAESNPDADILGTDACRKIAILTALVSGKLIPTENIHTEGIVNIRESDVKALASIGATVKLVGRGIIEGGEPKALVAPFVIPSDMPLSQVKGVYNAVEIMAEPLGNIMFYGQGAGAGATASAVVGDLMQVMCSGTHAKSPRFESFTPASLADRLSFKRYLAVDIKDKDKLDNAIGKSLAVCNERGEYAVITEPLSDKELAEKTADIALLSHIRHI